MIACGIKLGGKRGLAWGILEGFGGLEGREGEMEVKKVNCLRIERSDGKHELHDEKG